MDFHALRAQLSYSDFASDRMFECLVISDTVERGLYSTVSVRHVKELHEALAQLREMWARLDVLFVCREDMRTLHMLECKYQNHHQYDIPGCIQENSIKYAAYYVYLLFRYSVTSCLAGPCSGSSSSSSSSGKKRDKCVPHPHCEPIADIPQAWIDAFWNGRERFLRSAERGSHRPDAAGVPGAYYPQADQVRIREAPCAPSAPRAPTWISAPEHHHHHHGSGGYDKVDHYQGQRAHVRDPPHVPGHAVPSIYPQLHDHQNRF